jgi:hypothetical protein
LNWPLAPVGCGAIGDGVGLPGICDLNGPFLPFRNIGIFFANKCDVATDVNSSRLAVTAPLLQKFFFFILDAFTLIFLQQGSDGCENVKDF